MEQIDLCTDIGITDASLIFIPDTDASNHPIGAMLPPKNRREKSRDCLCQSHLNKNKQTLFSDVDRATGCCAPYKAIIYIEDNSFLEQTMIHPDS